MSADGVGTPWWSGAARLPAALLSPGGSRGRLSILIHHRVVPKFDPLMPDVPTLQEFESQVALLARIFNVMPLGDAVAALAAGRLPSRALAITFDDGYADNATLALPVLLRHRCAATFFIATGFLDGGRMFNDSIIEAVRVAGPSLDLSDVGLGTYELASIAQRRAAIDSLIGLLKYRPLAERDERISAIAQRVGRLLPNDLMMTRQQVRMLADAGMELGGHTANHPILAHCSYKAAEREIAGGRDELAEIIRQPIALFAYPNGQPLRDYDADHVEIVRRLGFAAAVSTCGGTADADSDRYQLPRFTPWRRHAAQFLAQLLANCRRAPQLPLELRDAAQATG